MSEVQIYEGKLRQQRCRNKFLFKDKCDNGLKLKGGGRNFERPNVERPVFRNLKMPMLKATRGPDIRFFNLRNFFIFLTLF